MCASHYSHSICVCTCGKLSCMYTYTYVDVQTANLRLHMAAAGSKGGNSRQGNNRQGGQQAAGTRDSRRQGSSTRNSYRAAGRAVAAGQQQAGQGAHLLLPGRSCPTHCPPVNSNRPVGSIRQFQARVNAGTVTGSAVWLVWTQCYSYTANTCVQ